MKNKYMTMVVGWGLVIAGGALFSSGAGFVWGMAGAYIAGGIYSAICGATVLGTTDDAER